MEILIYNVSHLEHPRPLEIMSGALESARQGNILEMIHHREPFLLYDIIRARGLCYETKHIESDSFRIYIAKSDILESFLRGALEMKRRVVAIED